VIRDAPSQQFSIRWLDGGREPQVKPNPAYPAGKDVDATAGAQTSCRVALPYPAKRIGSYIAECKLCGIRVGVTTAGRPDDPRSVAIGCKVA